MNPASVWLLDISAVDAEGEAVTLRLGSCGYVTEPTDSPPNVIYRNAISDPGDFSVDLFDAGQTLGDGHPSYGNISVVNVDGVFDDWTMTQGPKLDGRQFVLRRLDGPSAPYATAEIAAIGIIDSIRTDNGWVSLEIVVADRLAILDKPLQTNLYAGTTVDGSSPVLTEGNADLKGQPKYLAFGVLANIEPAPVNVYDEIWQVSDGAVTSIIPYDGRAPLVFAGNFASAAALKTALTTGTTIKTGQYGTVLSAGLVGVRCTPALPFTVDAVEGSNSKPGSVMSRILARFGLAPNADFDTASFAALDAAAPFDLGVTVDGDENCSAVLARVRASVGAFLYPDATGVFHTGRFLGPGTPVGSIDGSIVLTSSANDTVDLDRNPETNNVPVWRVTVNYGPIGMVQDASQVHQCVDDEIKAMVAVQTRQVVAESAPVKTLHPHAGEMTADTLVPALASAMSIGATLLSLYGVERRVLKLWLRREDAIYALNDTITISLARLGFDEQNMVLIGMRFARKDECVQLTLWG